MDLLKKLPGTILVLGICYVLPLLNFEIFTDLINRDLLIRWQIFVPMAVCTIVYLSQPSTSSDQIKNPEDKHSMLYLGIATCLSQLINVVEWAYFGNTDFALDLIAWTGIFIIIVGLFIRVWSIHLLGKFFGNDVRILPDHKLILDGPYAHVRHPSYTGAFLVALGIGIFLHAWFGTILTGCMLFAAYSYRIQVEEITMLRGFGKIYEDYQQRSYKLFPPIW